MKVYKSLERAKNVGSKDGDGDDSCDCDVCNYDDDDDDDDDSSKNNDNSNVWESHFVSFLTSLTLLPL